MRISLHPNRILFHRRLYRKRHKVHIFIVFILNLIYEQDRRKTNCYSMNINNASVINVIK